MGPEIARARELHQAGRRDDALALLGQWLDDHPHDETALNLAGAIRFELGRVDEAEALLRRLVTLAPAMVQARVNLAVTLQGRTPHLAAQQLRVAITLMPEHADAHRLLAGILHDGGDVDGALRHIRHAVSLTPGNLHMIGQLSVTLRGAGMAAEAARVLDDSLPKGHAARASIRNDLAGALLSLGQPAQAEAVMTEGTDALTVEGERILARARLYGAIAQDAQRTGLPDGLLVRAPFSVLSGYGDFAQHFVRALMGRGQTLRLAGLYGEEAWRPSFDDPVLRAAARRLGEPIRARLAVSMLTPPLVEAIPGVPTVNYSMFEGPRIPASWAACNRGHDLVLVPTESSRLAWIAAGHPDDSVQVCPPGIAPNPNDVSAHPAVISGPRGRALSDYRLRVLNISDFIARKNIDGLLRVWLRATRADDDAILVLKVGKGGTSLERDIAPLVARSEAVTGRRLQDAAPIAFLLHRYDDSSISSLYAMATHYFSLSHGEGWDLPITRAGCLGAGLIAPRHSAYTAYLNDRVAHLIPTTVGPARMPYSDDYYPPFHGLDWWHPDEEAAVDTLSRIIRDPDGEHRDAARHLVENFTWDAAARRLLNLLDGVGR
jgi:Flp pilus assembly protein TadD/glycosyltransferase involved in cell wall biosynthesis